VDSTLRTQGQPPRIWAKLTLRLPEFTLAITRDLPPTQVVWRVQPARNSIYKKFDKAIRALIQQLLPCQIFVRHVVDPNGQPFGLNSVLAESYKSLSFEILSHDESQVMALRLKSRSRLLNKTKPESSTLSMNHHISSCKLPFQGFQFETGNPSLTAFANMPLTVLRQTIPIQGSRHVIFCMFQKVPFRNLKG